MRKFLHTQAHTHSHTVMSHDNAQFDSILPDSLKCQPQVSVQVRRWKCVCVCEVVRGCRATIYWMSATKILRWGRLLPPHPSAVPAFEARGWGFEGEKQRIRVNRDKEAKGPRCQRTHGGHSPELLGLSGVRSLSDSQWLSLKTHDSWQLWDGVARWFYCNATWRCLFRE